MKLLKEHFVTVFPDNTEDREKYIDDVWNMLEASYASIGGTHSSKEELLDDNVMWKLVRRNGKIVAAVVYKLKMGRKAFLAGTDGTREGKEGLYSIIKEDASREERNAWVEVSGKPEYLYKKYGHVPIPNDIAEQILAKMGKKVEEKNSDGYHYTRKIGDDHYEKIMMGTLKTD